MQSLQQKIVSIPYRQTINIQDLHQLAPNIQRVSIPYRQTINFEQPPSSYSTKVVSIPYRQTINDEYFVTVSTYDVCFNSLQVDYQLLQMIQNTIQQLCFNSLQVDYQHTYFTFLSGSHLGFNSLQVDYQHFVTSSIHRIASVVSIPYRQTINGLVMTLTQQEIFVSIPYRQTINGTTVQNLHL